MFRKLLSFEEAKSRINEACPLKSLGAEELPLLEAVGRILAQDVASPIDVPSFNRSTVDGYAVKAEGTFGAGEDNPVVLKLVGKVDVGAPSNLAVEEGAAAEIVTGAPLPANADAVVMLEYTREKQGMLFIYRPVSIGENVMLRASDVAKDETVLKRGATLHSSQLGLMAALGFSTVKVFKTVRVAIISTGAEIVEPGRPLPAGKIYDINTYTLASAIAEIGGQPVIFGIVEDDDDKLLRSTLERAIADADTVVTSGSVSVGPKDVVPQILNKLGKPGIIIHGVAVKPGKPVAVAMVHGKLVFSLPGNPTSSLVIFHLFVRPILLKMMGKQEYQSPVLRAVTSKRLISARGRRTFVPVAVDEERNGQLIASPILPGQSGAITTLSKADGYVEVRETQQFIEKGKEVEVFLFRNLREANVIS